MSQCVIVLGPYRSGTSLTAQVIETLGVDFGPRSEWISSNHFNPGGYHERGDINAINRKLITSAGRTLGEALRASVRDLDGSFSYLAATAGAFGFAKDPFSLKPLIVAENEGAVAIANEEVALLAALGGPYRAREAGAGATQVWELGGRASVRRVRRVRRVA